MKKDEKPGIVREINLVNLNESIHLMSTDRREDIDFLLNRGLAALKKLQENGGQKHD